MKPSPFQDRDLSVRLKWPVISWSSMNAFLNYDKEKWYKQYYLGIKAEHDNANMKAGREIGERLSTDPEYLPEVPKPEIYEQEFFATLGKLQLTGHLDGWSPTTYTIDEFKTTVNEKTWTQATVDSHGQLTFYALLVWLNLKISPDKLRISLTSIPVMETGHFKVELDPSKPIKTFYTKRTMKDLLVFSALIRKTFKEMEEFIHTHEVAV